MVWVSKFELRTFFSWQSLASLVPSFSNTYDHQRKIVIPVTHELIVNQLVVTSSFSILYYLTALINFLSLTSSLKFLIWYSLQLILLVDLTHKWCGKFVHRACYFSVVYFQGAHFVHLVVSIFFHQMICRYLLCSFWIITMKVNFYDDW